MYCLPKIHKSTSDDFDDITLRPVVSQVNSSVSSINKWLNNFVKQEITYQSTFSIKNTSDLINKIKHINIQENDRLISFDIVNLFPSVPVDETKDIFKNLVNNTSMTQEYKDEIITLLNVCLQHNFYKFRDKLYVQKQGLNMGGGLSPLMSEIFMSHLENNHLIHDDLYNKFVRCWFRYVDDVFCIFSGNDDDLANFLSSINSWHNNIKFTYETEYENCLPFLDLKITKVTDHLEFNIYRKPTHTDNIIPNISNTPIQFKLASLRSLIYRLLNTPLNKKDFENEKKIIYDIAIKNGYSHNIVNNIIKKTWRKIKLKASTTLIQSEGTKRFHVLPYIGEVSQSIANYLKKLDINVSFKVTHNIKSSLCNYIDKEDPLCSSGVYKLNCSDCPATYIGMTNRTIKIRTSEHNRQIKNNNSGTQYSHFAEHILNSNHNFNIKDVEVLDKENNFYILRLKEKYFIHYYNTRHDIELVNETVTQPPLIVAQLGLTF